MAKTYLKTVKYQIHQRFEIQGIVDKHDIIGAVFGQSEGLLGDELDLKELQQGGKIGRIEVNCIRENSSTKGELIISSSMDMVQTSLLAAAIETVEKVGPYDSKFETVTIEDTRNQKRDQVKIRAKELLQKFMANEIPESQQITDEVRGETRKAEIQSFGFERLPAGPGIEAEPEIILVEGRADVINLLKHNVKNVVGMNGSIIPKSVIELSRRKSVTVFVDGDRGGLLNARQLCNSTKIDFIARAPDGKEVEELTGKEILNSLKKKLPSDVFFQQFKLQSFNAFEKRGFEGNERNFERRDERRDERREDRPMERREFQPRPFQRSFNSPRSDGFPRNNFQRGNFGRAGPRTGRVMMRRQFGVRMSFRPNSEMIAREPEIVPTVDEKKLFQPLMDSLKGTLSAKLLNEKNVEVKTVKIRDLLKELENTKSIATIVCDGVITKRVVDTAKNAGVKTIVGVKKGRIGTEENVRILIFNI